MKSGFSCHAQAMSVLFEMLSIFGVKEMMDPGTGVKHSLVGGGFC
jgi:hypothetical protein